MKKAVPTPVLTAVQTTGTALLIALGTVGSAVSAEPNDGTVQPAANVPLEPTRPAGTPVPPQATATAPAPAPRAVPVAARGEIRSIEPIRERPPGTGAGAVIGGVLGGAVGNQFGHGGGRAAMTVLGAAGGAVAGHNIERNINKRIVGYRVSVRLDDGRIRTFEERRLDGLQVGDRVRIEGKHLRRG